MCRLARSRDPRPMVRHTAAPNLTRRLCSAAGVMLPFDTHEYVFALGRVRHRYNAKESFHLTARCSRPISNLQSPIANLGGPSDSPASHAPSAVQVLAGSISTRISLHLPCLNRRTLSAHRVAWPIRIAVQ